MPDIALPIHVPNGVVLQGDSGWLSEVLQNLLKNCIKKTVIMEELRHVFDRLYRGKDANSAGYGIGLALCKSSIIRQGKSITAKNHSQGDAFFAIRFPK